MSFPVAHPNRRLREWDETSSPFRRDTYGLTSIMSSSKYTDLSAACRDDQKHYPDTTAGSFRWSHRGGDTLTQIAQVAERAVVWVINQGLACRRCPFVLMRLLSDETANGLATILRLRKCVRPVSHSLRAPNSATVSRKLCIESSERTARNTVRLTPT